MVLGSAGVRAVLAPLILFTCFCWSAGHPVLKLSSCVCPQPPVCGEGGHTPSNNHMLVLEEARSQFSVVCVSPLHVRVFGP